MWKFKNKFIVVVIGLLCAIMSGTENNASKILGHISN